MGSPNLYEIDLERKGAFCMACGSTEIHVCRSSNGEISNVFCLNRYQELLQERKNQAAKPKEQSPARNPKPYHSLSAIDPENMTATCAVCGSTKISNRYVSKDKSIRYECFSLTRARTRRHHRNRYVFRNYSPFAHSLSEIDEQKKTARCSICGPVEIYLWQGKQMGRRCSNASARNSPGAQKVRREINTTLIYRYRADHGCKVCRQKKNLLKLYLYRDKKEIEIERLLKLNRAQLMHEFGNCEVPCDCCRDLDDEEFT